MSPTYSKNNGQFHALPPTPMSSSSDKMNNEDLIENCKQNALLVEKYKLQLAVLKKQTILRNLEYENSGDMYSDSYDTQNMIDQLEMMKLRKHEGLQHQDNFGSSKIKDSNNNNVFPEHLKQTSMQDTLQRRTLAVQESIRQTLAVSGGGGGRGGVDPNNNSMQSLEPQSPRSMDDTSIADMLADPRWSGMKQYRGVEDRHDSSRRDNGKYTRHQLVFVTFPTISITTVIYTEQIQ